jgi:glycosyltransferase involved in cell wall biosynthesis
VPWDKVVRVRRLVNMWNRRTYGWFRPGGPVPIDRFDAAIVCPQLYAGSLARLKREGQRFMLATHIDATIRNTIRDFGDVESQQRHLLKIEREVYDQCDIVSGMGTWAANSARDDYGIPPDRALWVPPIAPLYGPRKHPDKKPGALPRIVFVGYDWERKGGPELLAWHQKHFADKAELHFVGGGEKIASGSNPKNVTVHGRVERDRLINELLPTMDFFVMPTKREMSCWAGIEAMGHGLPVVLSAIGGIPDLVIEGETGFLAKPNDEGAFVRAMAKLIEDPDLCRKMGEAARLRVSREFTREVVYSKLIDKVREVALSGERQPAGA